jgi:hypothetical protein
VDASLSSVSVSQTILTAENWYKSSGYGKATSIDAGFAPGDGGAYPNAFAVTPGLSWSPWAGTFRRRAGTGVYQIKRNAGASQSLYLDSVACKLLTLATLFCTRDLSVSNVSVSAGIYRAASHQAGLILNLDSATTPQNYVLCYLDGSGYARLEKVVGGVYSSVLAVAVTYVAGALLECRKYDTGYTLTYNGSAVGSVQTISDAGIVSNTLHGLFSTDPSNSFEATSLIEVTS